MMSNTELKNRIKQRRQKRRAHIKSNHNPIVKRIENTIWGDIKSFVTKKRMGRNITDYQTGEHAKYWLKKIMKQYGEDGDNEWKTFIKDLKHMSENPHLYKMVEVDFLSRALIRYPKMLITLDK